MAPCRASTLQLHQLGCWGGWGCCAAAPRCVLNARAAAAAAAAACWRHRVSAAHAGGAAGAANASWPQTQVGASQRVCHSLTRPSPAHLGSQRSCAIYRSQPASSSTRCEALDEHGRVRRRFGRVISGFRQPRPPAGRHGHKRLTGSRACSRAAEAWYSQRHGHTATPSPPSHLTVHSTTGQRLWGVERPARLDRACNARSRLRPRRRACLASMALPLHRAHGRALTLWTPVPETRRVLGRPHPVVSTCGDGRARVPHEVRAHCTDTRARLRPAVRPQPCLAQGQVSQTARCTGARQLLPPGCKPAIVSAFALRADKVVLTQRGTTRRHHQLRWRVRAWRSGGGGGGGDGGGSA